MPQSLALTQLVHMITLPQTPISCLLSQTTLTLWNNLLMPHCPPLIVQLLQTPLPKLCRHPPPVINPYPQMPKLPTLALLNLLAWPPIPLFFQRLVTPLAVSLPTLVASAPIAASCRQGNGFVAKDRLGSVTAADNFGGRTATPGLRLYGTDPLSNAVPARKEATVSRVLMNAGKRVDALKLGRRRCRQTFSTGNCLWIARNDYLR